MDFTDLINAMEQRTAIYNLLARIFRVEVDQELLDELLASKFPQRTESADINDAYLRIYTYLRGVNDETLDELACDYARIFLGFGSPDGKAAYPYESVYVSDKGLMMQDARDEVLAIYKSQGLTPDATWHDPEDHLALELEFIKYLSSKTADALRSQDQEMAFDLIETQANFIDDHIMAYNQTFTARVHRYAQTPFYPAYADLLHAYLADDQEILAELIS